MGDPAPTLTLFGRKHCHLCDDMAEALAPLATEWGVGVRYVDVDGDPAIASKYGDQVPVLAHGDTLLCRHFLDPQRVRAYLTEIR